MIVLIDNYDSFTFNIAQYCMELGADLRVIRNDEMSVKEISALKPDKLILSPGPSAPDNAGVTLDAIGFFKDRCPILGVCLGHQAIAQAFGMKIVHAKRLMHGKTDTIRVIRPQSAIFEGIPRAFTATRYHSLAADRSTIVPETLVTAESDDGEIMAIEIDKRPIFGVQFHPESVMSEYGHALLGNFLKL
ncbi:MAG: aminodeoxychorismate/anthranilate synthase component II [Helicobacteraceae bacterium]|jgi:anthranilate synthase component 2|nr:aminodeoxychorismate/anthranilate synthase component II [Helicobacteraceae bacterium]